MDLELALAAALLALVLLALLPPALRRLGRAGTLLAAGGWIALSAAVLLAADRYRQPRRDRAERVASDRPIEDRAGEYSGSITCRACHLREYETWHDSYHRTMTQVADRESVLAPFADVSIQVHGRTYNLEERDDEFWVDMNDPAWRKRDGGRPERVQRQVVMTTGSHHMQCFWYATGHTRKIGLLPFGYRVAEERWIPLDAAFLSPPGTRQALGKGRWNTSCNKCHVTGGEPRIEGEHDMDTRVAELGISCESCHGPADEHVAANRDPTRRFGLHLANAADPTIVDPRDLAPDRAAQVCGQCHAVLVHRDPFEEERWAREGFRYRPGDDLHETRILGTVGENQFWSDGMIRSSGREYNALVRTPCFLHGDTERGVMTCSSCHVLHKADDDPRPVAEWANDLLAPGMGGDAACTQCHAELAEAPEIAAHSRHAAGTPGSGCLDCHMPNTTYGLLKATRTHEIESPDVATTLATGRPNACNLCHLDQTLAWTAEHITEWYEQPPAAALRGGQGLTEDERTVSAALLGLLRGDAGQRAILAWNLGWNPALETAGSTWQAPFLLRLLDDPYPAVRFLAHNSLLVLPGFEDLEYDHLADAPERTASISEGLERWRRAPGERSGPEILIDSPGVLDQAALERLLSERDDRDVYIAE